MYRTHRYIYICEEYAKDEGEELSKEAVEIAEWYALIIKMVIHMDFSQDTFEKESSIFIHIFNSFVSKKNKDTFAI